MLPAVHIEGLTKKFGACCAVHRLDLEVRAGEVVGLIGPNGAGKTTTLRVLAGLLRPTAGRAFVCGIDVTEHAVQARRNLGFMTASTGLYERLSPRELLTTFGQLHGISGATLRARIEALSAELGMAEVMARPCGKLSSGQRQRVSIARAVLHDPEVYVLDEPTAALDPLASRAILDLVRGACERGKAVLFSTHRMEEAEFLCHRLVLLSGGRAVAQGTAASLREQSGQSSLTGAFLHYATGPAA